MKILLTAPPRTGKSTILKKIIDSYSGPKHGVVTLEMRDENNERVGFKVVNLEGEEHVFLHITDVESDVLVGNKYRVDLNVLDNFVVAELEKSLSDKDSLIIVDEIGRGQAQSQKFLETVSKLLESDSNILGTIVFDDEIWAREFKNHPGVLLIEVSQENRDYLPEVLMRVLENLSDFNKLDIDQQRVLIDKIKKLFENNESSEINKFI